VLGTKCAEPNCELHRLILEFGSHVAGSAEVTAVSLFDYCLANTPNSKAAIEAVLVIRNFPARMMSYVKTIAERTVVVIAVDQWIFERDIERGFLGEASAGTLVFPYVAVRGESYLHVQEVALKKRLILELLENLRLSFPELADRLRIKPEYFMYEVLMNRVRVFPPLAQCTSNFMHQSEGGGKPNPTLEGYVEALSQLVKEEKVKFLDGYVMMPRRRVSDSQKPKLWLTNISRNAPRTFFTPIFQTFPQLLNLFNQNMETFPKFQTFRQWKKSLDATRTCVNPQKYVFVPTGQGLVSLAQRLSVEAFVREKMLQGKTGEIKLEAVGGVLNDVYLVRIKMANAEKRILVKRFKDWSGFKWFPLNLWSLGTQKFAVLGKSRLEREFATSEILRNKGFNVPKVLHVNHGERLVFMEYINGENLANQIKKIANAKSEKPGTTELTTLTRVGELIARVHSLGVELGDTKPENVIIDPAGQIFLLDFEQASPDGGGDKSWDVAEFLYYSGHYLPPLRSVRKAEGIARAFISGYLGGGGDVNVVKKAAKSKYTRVFGLFTAPTVLTAMAAVCKKSEVAS
jgi:tRNA A-37 threonylcarbamoyl transferase component Bud32